MGKKKDFTPFEIQIAPQLEDLPRINSRTLSDLQGNLKDLSELNYLKLRTSILHNGWIVPLFIWRDPRSEFVYTLDGNQRLRFVNKEHPDGVMLPYIEIAAANHIEAKEKILVISSQYGEVTKEGVDEFLADMPAEQSRQFIKDMTTFGSFLDRKEEEMEEGPILLDDIVFTVTVELDSMAEAMELVDSLTLKGMRCQLKA